MRLELSKVFCVVLVSTSIFVRPVSGYEIETHGLITQQAFARSVVNKGYLQTELGMSLDERFNRLLAQEWLITGSKREDDYISGGALSPVLFRFKNHFWDPYFKRGLTNSMTSGFPAYEWALEEQSQISGQDFSWRDARQYFVRGLTAQTPSEREEALAKTFRSIGHILHSVQDMASPEHTDSMWSPRVNSLTAERRV